VVTKAFAIPAHFLIHAVGPVWRGGDRGDADLLRSAYRRAFLLAEQFRCQSVASPSLSTGAFGYPIALAAPLALEEARSALARGDSLRRVEFVLFDSRSLAVFTRVAQEMGC
jgi:O-acetyl-ADP-ribose deacetylase (regulator of RNase III)